MSSKVSPIILNNGVEMPPAGFGVWQVPDDEAQTRPSPRRWRPGTAASTQRRSTAMKRAPARRSPPSGCSPSRGLFVTTKLWNKDQGTDSTPARLRHIAGEAGLEYVDLYLIHWPMPAKERYVDTYRAFEKLHADGRIRAIGVPTSTREHLERLIGETSVIPAVNRDRAAPGTSSSTPPASTTGAGHCHRGLVPARPGQGIAGGPGDRGDRPEARPHPGSGHSCAGTLQIGNVVIPKSRRRPRSSENIDGRLRPGHRGPRGDQRAERGPAPSASTPRSSTGNETSPR